jgi:polysaccharide deacetylase family protein (PEP-CTERM system associated)
VTRRVLALLAERRVRGTFFVVGELALAHPDLVRAVAAAGHEIALHGWRHVPLTDLDAPAFHDDTRRGKALLEDLSGTEVVGFRAPSFSLVAASSWAADVLAELGFAYSSSVLPARNPLFGWPGMPRRPFRFASGLLELPVPVTTIGGVTNAYLGGSYLRVLPPPVVHLGLRRARSDEVLWTYCHPYDFDPDEPFARRPGLSRAANRLLWVNRARMLRRVALLLEGRAAEPLATRAATLVDVPSL